MSLSARVQIAIGRKIMRLDARRLRRLLRRRPTELGGRTLDPHLQQMLAIQSRVSRNPLHTLAVVDARREYRLVREIFEDPMTEPTTLDRTIPGAEGSIAVRIYGERPDVPGPGVVFFHGGGGVIGDLWTHDIVCRRLAVAAGCPVISVDYRLAPDAPFPAGHDDAVAAFRWVHDHADALGIDPHRIAVAGDSMGANLAGAVCLACRGGAAPSFALLIYPGTDFVNKAASRRELGRGFFLEGATIDWFHEHYLSGADPADPRASIINADLTDLPPMHVVTAGFDPLRDEGQAFAEAVKLAGSPVSHREYPSLVHGFVQLTGVCPAAAAAIADFGDVLRRALAPV